MIILFLIYLMLIYIMIFGFRLTQVVLLVLEEGLVGWVDSLELISLL